MGNYLNKLIFDIEGLDSNTNTEIEHHSEAKIAEQNNLCTPPATQTKSVDPRSITTGITRTPIQATFTDESTRRINAIPRYLQSKPYLETDVDEILSPFPVKYFQKRSSTQIETPPMKNNVKLSESINVTPQPCPKLITPSDEERQKVLGIDPRSPAANFDRTPILLPKSLESLKSRAKGLLSKQGSYETDMWSPRYSYCETNIQLCNVMIPEVQALPDMLKIVDTVFSDNYNNSPTPNTVNSSYLSINSINNTSLENHEFTVMNSKRRTSLHVQLQEADAPERVKDSSQGTATSASEEGVIIVFDDETGSESLPISKSTGNNPTSNNRDKLDVMEQRKDAHTDNKIISDRKKVFASDTRKIGSEVSKTRTPLGNRSNKDKLREMGTKSTQHLLRSTISGKVQQENTPPHKKCIAAKPRSNGIHWDPDSTVLI